MFLTIQTLFDDANIVSAIIRRVNQTRKDTIYWQQYLTFRRVTTRVFKDYIGSVTGVMAGSINSRFGEKPIRERRNIGSGYGEIAYLGDAYSLAPDYGVYAKMVMTRASFNKLILGSSEFGEQYKMILGSNEMKLSTGLVSSSLASEVFTGIGLPRIEIKEDYVKDQTGKNVQIYADNRITLLPSDNIGYMRHHTPYEATDPVQGRTYIPSEGQMLISNYRDKNGRYMEYTAEWIPQISNPDLITNFDLSEIASIQSA